jgi:TRAP-type C4-dicarboxylate transport system substrate-binding protein
MGTWNKLPEDVRKMVQEAADESSIYQRKLWKEATVDALEKVQAQGVTVHHPDKTTFRQKVKKMHESYKGTEIGELIEEINKVQ